MTHQHSNRSPTRFRLGAVFLLTALVLAVEVAGGIMSGSLALLGDAGHMLTDLTAIGISWLASRLGERRADPNRTYGYARLEILAALANGLLLVGLAGGLIVEAVKRIAEPSHVSAGIMLWVAMTGLAANVAAIALLHRGRENLNLRSVYLHVAGDTISSFAVIGGALALRAGGPEWIDPAITLVLVMLVIVSSVRLILESTEVLLEAVPRGISSEAVRQRIRAIPGVADLHDLHIWSITSDLHALSGHLTLDPGLTTSPDAVLRDAQAVLSSEFAITHSTLQLEGVEYAGCDQTHD